MRSGNEVGEQSSYWSVRAADLLEVLLWVKFRESATANQ